MGFEGAGICRFAQRVGARVILDVYQVAGTVPMDLGAWQADFAVGGSVKWLCGGPGNAFLYTRPELLEEAKPSFTGWLSRSHPFDFDLESEATRDDAMRMMNGPRSSR